MSEGIGKVISPEETPILTPLESAIDTILENYHRTHEGGGSVSNKDIFKQLGEHEDPLAPGGLTKKQVRAARITLNQKRNRKAGY